MLKRRSGTQIASGILTRHLESLENIKCLEATEVDQVCKVAETLVRIDAQRCDVILKALALFATGRINIGMPALQSLVRDMESGATSDERISGTVELFEGEDN